MACFAESNVLWSPDKDKMLSTYKMLVKLGYDTVWVNNFVEDLSIKTGKKNKSKSVPLKTPGDILLSESGLRDVGAVKQHSRFTMILSDASQVVRIQKDDVVQSHDILAVQPNSEKMFNLACKQLEIDIISLDLTQKSSFFFKRQAIGVAIERGVHFEVTYAPMIRDATARRQVISNAIGLAKICKGKNIIISAGAEKVLEYRGPYDVANLGLLFNLSHANAKAAVSSNCRDVVLHARARKLTRGVLCVSRICDLGPHDGWKVGPVEEVVDSEGGEASDHMDRKSCVVMDTGVEEEHSGEPQAKKLKADQ